jgi:hypothetical protein
MISAVMEHEVLIANQLSETLLHADPALAHQTISEMLRLAHSQVIIICISCSTVPGLEHVI